MLYFSLEYVDSFSIPLGFVDYHIRSYSPFLKKKSAVALRRPSSHDFYSAHTCVGNMNSYADESTRCHFRNVCIKLNELPGNAAQSVEMSYYRPPNAVRMPLYWSHRTNIVSYGCMSSRRSSERLTKLSVVRALGEYRSSISINSRACVHERTERCAVESGREFSQSFHPSIDVLSSNFHLQILSESFWPENFAHSLGDDFLPAYRLAKSFGLWSRDIQVTFHPVRFAFVLI